MLCNPQHFQSAIQHIDSSGKRIFNPDTYEDCLHVCMAAKSANPDTEDGIFREIANEFAQASEKYTDKFFHDMWASLKGEKNNAYTYKSIFSAAYDAGWSPPREPDNHTIASMLATEWDLSEDTEGMFKCPYHLSKNIPTPMDTRRIGNTTLVPYYDIDGQIISILRIWKTADGSYEKKYAKGSKASGAMRGSLHPDDFDLAKRFIITEGLATQAAVELAVNPEFSDDLVVISVGSCSNLHTVTAALSKRYPSAELIIACDDEGVSESPGRVAAEKVAKLLPWIRVAYPEFIQREGKATTDFHDLWQREGANAVAVCIENAVRIRPTHDADQEDFQLSNGRVDRFLDFEPPSQKFLIPDLIPEPVIGGILGAGGSRKSTVLLQLACSIAAGLPWAGGMGGLPDPGGVIFVSCEDDDAVVHRRLRATIQGMSDGIRNKEIQITELIRANLYVLTRPGKNTLLVEKKSNQAEPTAIVDQLIKMAIEVQNLRLVIIEPISRLFGGNENDAADMSRMVEALESIREATGVTVLVAHHISKAAYREDSSNQASARGSSALVDGMRWVAQLRTANTKEVQHEPHTRWACFDVVKSNYVAIQNGIWLRASNDGYLQRADPHADRSVAITANIVSQVAADADAGTFWTKRGFAEKYASSDKFSMGRDALEKEVEACIAADRIYRWEVCKVTMVFPEIKLGHRKGTELLLPPPPCGLLKGKPYVDLRNRYAAAEEAFKKSA